MVLALVLAGSARAEEEPQGAPRVVVADVAGSEPSAGDVALDLRWRLADLGVEVDLLACEAAPADSVGWLGLAGRAASEEPGTLALFGYVCDDAGCRLVVVEPASGALVEVPVADGEAGPAGRATGLATTAGETLISTVLPELERLVGSDDEEEVSPPANEIRWLERAHGGEDADGGGRPLRRRLHVEGGYHGDHALPDGQPLHGPWLGLAVTPTAMLRPALSVGWLGLRQGEIEAGSVEAHRLAVGLSLRLVFSMGLASVALAPVGRLDVVFSSADPTAAHEPSESATELELQAGGMTTWRLPLPARDLDALVGAGVMASLLSRDLEVDGETAIRASSLRVVWHVGVSWGAF